jgi:uncharacterized protein (DUF488 family)
MDKIITIGAYGFSKETFFQALIHAKVDVFCDIRMRRGVRGSEYSFANSERLQKELQDLGIHYLHLKDLAPDQAIRDTQKKEDEARGIAKRSRQTLGPTFIQLYEQEYLAHFHTEEFSQKIGLDPKIVAFFCVERKPEACHRSLVARKLSNDLQIPIEHLEPPMIY